MAINTTNTLLKYAQTCANQVETATVAGTISTAGNATITITGKAIAGSPLAVSVAVAMSDTASQVAAKIITALQAKPEITQYFTVGGTGATVTLTRIIPSENDSTLNIAIANGTCAGLTAAPTSANTTPGGTFTKLVDIVSYPDLGSAPSKLDTTTLTETANKTSILGLSDSPDLSFDCNYDEAALSTINGLTASNYYLQLDFGDADGRFNWQGQVRAFANGGGVDEVRKMTVVSSAATQIAYSLS